MAKKKKKKSKPRKSKTQNSMAKKKKKGKKRRRMSGAGDDGFDFISPILAVSSGAGSKALNKVIPASVNPKLVSGLKIGVGVLLPMAAQLVKDPQSRKTTRKYLAAIGTGMAVEGSLALLAQTGVLADNPDMDDKNDFALELSEDVLGEDVLGDDRDDIPVVNGADDIPVINFADDYDDDDMLM